MKRSRLTILPLLTAAVLTACLTLGGAALGAGIGGLSGNAGMGAAIGGGAGLLVDILR